MAQEIGRLDPYGHLRTSSFAGSTRIRAYEDASLDFTQMHIYEEKLYRMLPLLVPHFKRYGKPFFVGEFGNNSADGADDQDKNGVFLHAGLWIAFMQDISGNAMPWWWDTHIHPNNLYHHFGALSRFGAGLDRRAHRFTPRRQRLRMESAGKEYFFELTGLESEGISLFWLCDADGLTPRGGAGKRSYEGVRIRLPLSRDGLYRVEHWDTYRGVIVRIDPAQCQKGLLEIELPLFRNDIALKILPG